MVWGAWSAVAVSLLTADGGQRHPCFAVTPGTEWSTESKLTLAEVSGPGVPTHRYAIIFSPGIDGGAPFLEVRLLSGATDRANPPTAIDCDPTPGPAWTCAAKDGTAPSLEATFRCSYIGVPEPRLVRREAEATPPGGAHGEWVLENQGHAWGALRGVWGASGNDVWAVGERGTLLHFDGARWAPVEADSATDLLAVGGSGPDDVWAVGTRGTALHWDGLGWHATRTDVESTFSHLFIPARGEAWVVSSDEGKLLRWNGSAWTSVDPGLAAFSLWGSGADDVWVLSHSGELARFDGRAWRRGAGPQAGTGWVLNGASARNVLAVGAGGRIARFDGKRWWNEPINMGCPCDFDLQAVWSAGPTDAWAFGPGDRAAHFDGQRWIGQPAPAGMSQVTAAWGRAPGDGWAVDARGAIFHYDGTTWKTSTPSGPALERVYAVTTVGGELWVAGTGMMRLAHGTWEAVPALKNNVLRSIAGSAPDDVFALTITRDYFSTNPSDAAVWHYDGKTWTRDRDGPTGAHVLWQRQPGELWATGDRGEVWRRLRGKWSVLDPGEGMGLRSYAIASDGAGGAWVTGEGVLKHCRPSGCSSLKSPLESTTFPLVSVWPISAQRAYLAMGIALTGPEIESSHSDEREGADAELDPLPFLATWDGKAWKAVASGPTPFLLGVTATGPADVWALGVDGVVLHFDGKAWKRSRVPGVKDLTHIIALDGVVRVIGAHGRVFRHAP